MLTLNEQVTIIDLLLEREQAFVRIREIEQQIQIILGEPYPYPPFPELLSCIPKGKRLSKVKKITTKQKFRPLRKNEKQYHVFYRYQEEDLDTQECSYEVIREMIEHPNSFLMITKVNVVALEEDGTEKEIELYSQ